MKCFVDTNQLPDCEMTKFIQDFERFMTELTVNEYFCAYEFYSQKQSYVLENLKKGSF